MSPTGFMVHEGDVFVPFKFLTVIIIITHDKWSPGV